MRLSVESLNICHITAPAPFGGLEAVVAALATGTARRGHRVTIVAVLDQNGACPFAELASHGIELVAIRTAPRRYRAQLGIITRELTRRRPVVAHTHGYHADLIGRRAARRADVPIVSTVHGFTAGPWKNRLYEWLDRRTLRGFDAVIAVSEPLRVRLADSGIPLPRLQLLINAGVEDLVLAGRSESRRHLGLPREGLVAGWIGRLSREKGPDVFLEALRISPSWHGSFIGEGPLGSMLKERVRGAGISDRVHWHGAVPNAAQYFDAFDAIVLSSRTEGTPIVLLEAMTAGVPLVATAVGGIPDLVSPDTALLVPPEDPAAIARALDLIAQDGAGAAARAAAARTRLRQNCSTAEWLEGYERIYRTVSQGAR